MATGRSPSRISWSFSAAVTRASSTSYMCTTQVSAIPPECTRATPPCVPCRAPRRTWRFPRTNMAAYVDKTVTGRIRGRTRRFRVPNGTAGGRGRRSPSRLVARTSSRPRDGRPAPTGPQNPHGLSFYMFIRAGAAIAVSNVRPPSPPRSLRPASPPPPMQRAEFPVIPRSRFSAFSFSFFLSVSFLLSALLPPPARPHAHYLSRATLPTDLRLRAPLRAFQARFRNVCPRALARHGNSRNAYGLSLVATSPLLAFPSFFLCYLNFLPNIIFRIFLTEYMIM